MLADLTFLTDSVVVAEDGGWIAGKEELRERLGALYGDVSGDDGRPTDSQLERMARLASELEAKKAEFETEAGKIDSLNRILAKRDLEPLTRLTLEDWEARQEGAGGSASMASLVILGLVAGF